MSSPKKKIMTLRDSEVLEYYEDDGEFRVAFGDVSDRVFLMSSTTFGDIEKSIEALFGTGAATVLLKIGEGMANFTTQFYGNETDIKKRIEQSKLRFGRPSRWGWGDYKLLITEDPPSAQLKHYNSPFAPLCHLDNETKKFMNHFMVGYFNAYFSTVFGKKMNCVKTKCIVGGDEFCEYDFKPS
jgi:predicted hydrocarbon binding protein